MWRWTAGQRRSLSLAGLRGATNALAGSTLGCTMCSCAAQIHKAAQCAHKLRNADIPTGTGTGTDSPCGTKRACCDLIHIGRPYLDALLRTTQPFTGILIFHV